MTRQTFRAAVATPRPASAWVLVTVASATLWITQQLDAWVMAVQAAAIVASLWRRDRPHAWQRSPLALNLGMIAIVAVTIAVSLRGVPSTIPLAHFAALTQALQLCDARPRRTEFLLVALALFQVVLASNLTDSVFFPPLLFAFVLASVWTLLVHTLRIEASEAGHRRELDHTLTPGLLRTTLLASGLSVVLALALFLVLPRLRTSVLSSSALAGIVATAGFSDRVELGDIGRIRQDATVVMRIETIRGERLPRGSRYWRGLAFDHFDGTTWSVTPSRRNPVPGSPEGGVSLGPRGASVTLAQQIVREPVTAGVLFAMGNIRAVQGTVRHLERDVNGGLYAVGQADDRIRYTVDTGEITWGDPSLRRDLASIPARGPTRQDDRYLSLPDLSPRIGSMADEITRDARTDADRARAIERFLLANGRYSDTPPPLSDEGIAPIEQFLLGELAAHCEYFASGFVVLARSAGLPARLVNGFAGGRDNRIGGFTEVTRSDAHSWAEVHYRRAGWVRYDPTPPDLRFRPAVALSFQERARELASALELWWFQSVVGFDRSDQIRTLKRAWLAWKGNRQDRGAPEPGKATSLSRWKADVDWGTLALVTAGVGCLALLAVRLRRRRGGRTLPASYALALRMLARRGLHRGPTRTARAFCGDVAEALSAPVAAAFENVTEAYLAERFGGQPGPGGAASLDTLRDALREDRRSSAKLRRSRR